MDISPQKILQRTEVEEKHDFSRFRGGVLMYVVDNFGIVAHGIPVELKFVSLRKKSK